MPKADVGSSLCRRMTRSIATPAPRGEKIRSGEEIEGMRGKKNTLGQDKLGMKGSVDKKKKMKDLLKTCL